MRISDWSSDVCSSDLFGSVLQRALVKWRAGAADALNAFIGEIGSLDPKDFAYLFRFRLLGEGQRMSDYLEWIFGEGLKTLVDEKVEWGDGSFARLDEKGLSSSIEGAFDEIGSAHVCTPV